jgi:chorismate mutase
MRRLLKNNAGPLGEKSVVSIFRRIMGESRHLQSSPRKDSDSRIRRNEN